MTTFTVPVTITMTDQQVQEWAQDNGIEIAEVPNDVNAFLLHNLLIGSRTQQDYWNTVDTAPTQIHDPSPATAQETNPTRLHLVRTPQEEQ